MIKFILILVYLCLIFLLSIIYKKFNPSNKEFLRKIIHIGIGPLIPIAKYLEIDRYSALLFTSIIAVLIVSNYKYKLFPTIEDVDRKSFGTLFYCLSLFILIYLYWDKDPSSLIVGFFIMTFGDGFAGLIGKNYESKSWLFLEQKKSLYGTITMFLTSCIVIVGIGYFFNYSFNISFFLIALISTFLEQISIFGIDNLIVPVAGGIFFNIFITGL